MLKTLDRGTLRDLRDRAMPLICFAGGLRRSEIVGLDVDRDDTTDRCGWIEILDRGLIVTLRGKTGWREAEIGRGSSEVTCPVVALQTWPNVARIRHGPLFRRVTGQGKDVGPDRLTDQKVARLVKRASVAVGVRGRSPGGRTGGEVCRPFAVRRPRLVGRGRRALSREAARPRQRRDDPPLSAAPRALPRQFD